LNSQEQTTGFALGVATTGSTPVVQRQMAGLDFRLIAIIERFSCHDFMEDFGNGARLSEEFALIRPT